MSTNPILTGTLFAVLAAVSFGITTPFIQRFGAGLGPFTTAALLYLGAGVGTLAVRPRWRDHSAEPAVRRKDLPRLVAVAVIGAALAPSFFAWGLQRVPPSFGSLLLNFEAVFTVGLAALVYREHAGGRVLLAIAFMVAGGVTVVAGTVTLAAGGLAGAVAIVVAVALWALDNTLTRPLADLDPTTVVRGKALLGALLTFGLALALREAVPHTSQLAGLLACGASGYGLSLRLFLLAQRRVGAGRTSSVFAVAPFIGAGTAWILGDRALGGAGVAAAILFALGVALHVTERHHHRHVHRGLEHEHAHRHDDPHHAHPHETYPEGTHSHQHRHEPVTHGHAHAPDAHHRHGH